MTNYQKNLIVTIFYVLTSILTVLILYTLEKHLDVAIYSIMLWFVIPVGAIISGMVAASGYYLGAIVLNCRPHISILINMFAISFLTYLLINLLDYYTIEIDDTKLSGILTFWKYLEIILSNTAIELGVGRNLSSTPIEIGKLGYLGAFLQIVGFAFGGFWAYVFLIKKTFCEKCGLYFKNLDSFEKYSGNGDAVIELLNEIYLLSQQSKPADAIAVFVANKSDNKFNSKKHHLRVKIIVKNCTGCKEYCLSVRAYKSSSHGWDEIDELGFDTFTNATLSIK